MQQQQKSNNIKLCAHKYEWIKQESDTERQQTDSVSVCLFVYCVYILYKLWFIGTVFVTQLIIEMAKKKLLFLFLQEIVIGWLCDCNLCVN